MNNVAVVVSTDLDRAATEVNAERLQAYDALEQELQLEIERVQLARLRYEAEMIIKFRALVGLTSA